MQSNNKNPKRLIDTMYINKKLTDKMYFEDISTEYDKWADDT